MASLQCGITGWLGPLRHQVTLLHLTSSMMVTASRSGQLWVWDLCGNDVIRPRVMLVGHRAAVTALVHWKLMEDSFTAPFSEVIVSASEDGELIMWNVDDGRCLKTNPRAFNGTPTNLCVTPDGQSLICSGNSSEIQILDSHSLEIIQTLEHHDNWINSLLVHRLEEKDILFSLSFDGALRAWSLEDMMRTKEALPLRLIFQDVTECASLSVSEFNSELMMVVSSEKCLVLSSGGFNKLQSIACPDICGWSGGRFLDQNKIILWTSNEKAYIYKLPLFPSATNFSMKSATRSKPSTKEGAPQEATLIAKFYQNPDAQTSVEGGTRAKVFSGVMEVIFPRSSDAAHRLVSFSTLHGKTILTTWPFFPSKLPASGAPLSIDSNADEAGQKGFLQAQESNEWRLNNLIPTAVSLLRERWFVQGYEDGTIRITALENFNLHKENMNSRFLKGHTGRITCLVAPDIQKQYLLSGSADFTVKVWNIETGELLYTFLNHTGEVLSFVIPPPDAGPRMRGCVCSIGKDRSLSIFSLEDMKTIYLFAGHPFPISHIHWRVKDDYLIVSCSDGTVYVWQMGTGHLDRRATGQVAADIVSSCDCQIRINHDFAFQAADQNKVLQCFSVMSDWRSADVQSTVLLFNSKKLISDFHEHTGSIADRRILELSVETSSSPAASTPTSSSIPNTPNTPAAGAISHPPGYVPLPIPALQGAAQKEKRLSQLAHRLSGSHMKSLIDENSVRAGQKDKDKEKEERERERERILASSIKVQDIETSTEFSLIRILLSTLHPWGLDPEMDLICEERIGLKKFPPHVSFAISGANGNLSIFAPGYYGRVEDWSISPYHSAIRLLCLVGIFKSVLNVQGFEEDVSKLMAFFCTLLPEKVAHFKEPGLSVLAKFWQDPMTDIQQASRSLILASLLRMDPQQKNELVDFWSTYLPYGNTPKKSKTISSVILGIVGTEFPDMLNSSARQRVARSLISVMSDESLSIIRVSAADLIGKGYSCWRGNTNDVQVIKLLFSHAFPKKQPSLLVNSLAKVCKLSLVLIADCIPPTFVTVLTSEMMISKSVGDRIGALKLLSLVTKKRPQVLSLHLPKVIQSIVELLDPNVPQMRDLVIQPTTATLHDLVTTYSSISFHGASQRLAVGAADGCVVIYDLKTATRWQVLEGHFGPVTAITFSKDGANLISFSSVDAVVRVWQTSSSFFGLLGNGSRCIKAFKVRDQPTSPPLANEWVGFEWLSPKRVVLYNGNDEPFNFSL